MILLGPPNLPCKSFQFLFTAVSGLHRKACFSFGSNLPSIKSTTNPPTEVICMKPCPLAPAARINEAYPGGVSMRNSRSGVSAHQQIRANDKGRSASWGIVSKRNCRILFSESMGIWCFEKGTLLVFPSGPVIYITCWSVTLAKSGRIKPTQLQ